jgi:hypothetical protein
MEIQDITQDITSLHTPPTTSNPDNFDVNADAFLLGLKVLSDEMGVLIPQLNTFGDEANALADEMNSIATTVTDNLSTIEDAANAAPEVLAVAGIDFASFSTVDGELIVGYYDSNASTPSIVDGEFIITY